MIELYRRHGTGCPTVTPGTPESMMSHEAKRLFLGCDCPIWVTGNLNGEPIHRQSCKTRDLDEARRVVERITAGMPGAVVQMPGAATPDALGPKVAHCTTRFLESLESTVRDTARKTHKLVLRQFAEFCAENGITHVRQINIQLCDSFVESMADERERSTLKTYAGKFGRFLKWCEKKGFITERLAERLEKIEFEHVQAQPFEAEEVAKLTDAATGLDRLLIELMSSTGIRISDALQFDVRNLRDGEQSVIYRFRMQKRRRTARPKWCEIFLTHDLRDRIMVARADWLSPEMPFKNHGSASANYMRVYKKLQALGSAVGVDDARCHRFRDYFAVDLLQRGVSIGDVSAALHHESVTTTEKSYAAWTTGRARRLEGVLATARLQA